MKKILLVGSGAREVAIARKIKTSRHDSALFCASPTKNPHISSLCEEYFCVSLSNNKEIVGIANHIVRLRDGLVEAEERK